MLDIGNRTENYRVVYCKREWGVLVLLCVLGSRIDLHIVDIGWLTP